MICDCTLCGLFFLSKRGWDIFQTLFTSEISSHCFTCTPSLCVNLHTSSLCRFSLTAGRINRLLGPFVLATCFNCFVLTGYLFQFCHLKLYGQVPYLCLMRHINLLLDNWLEKEMLYSREKIK